MKASEFDYQLPEELIAQKSAEPRESANLLVLDRTTGDIKHQHVSDLSDHLRSGDVLVVNSSKVFNARLKGHVGAAKGELFLVKPIGERWECLGKPGKKLRIGSMFQSEGPSEQGLSGKVMAKHEDGSLLIDFGLPKDEVMRRANVIGEIPVPPYVKSLPKDRAEYQTVYARHEGSVAAPTAGFHLTKPLIEQIKNKGIEILEVTLHVGLGTFLPIRVDDLSEHQMHSEWVEIPEATAAAINRAKSEYRRVIAIGTTTTRALEGAAQAQDGPLAPWQGEVNIFISPGFEFQVIDGLLTNFHLPKSTLLVLVSAFAGREKILAAYREAVERRYRFYSFGDAMLIV
jgi:S-adenosylmethionine:tRNA ribosyltransferase-isomerase